MQLSWSCVGTAKVRSWYAVGGTRDTWGAKSVKLQIFYTLSGFMQRKKWVDDPKYAKNLYLCPLGRLV